MYRLKGKLDHILNIGPLVLLLLIDNALLISLSFLT